MYIRTYIGEQALGVLAAYRGQDAVLHICGVYAQWDNSLRVFIPRGHALKVGDRATLHLDNRTGVDELDAELKVYRMSYKGEVVQADEDWATLVPRECQVMHGTRCILDLRAPGYAFPSDPRPLRELPLSPLEVLPAIERKDDPNKIGVLVTLAPEQPHTTVLAFLSSEDDDIFLITLPGAFKSQLLKRDGHCFFVIDERATFTFERSIQWNYTLIEATAARIARDSPLFMQVQHAFIDKNPWEMAFFIQPELEMYHLRRERIVYPGELRRVAVPGA